MLAYPSIDGDRECVSVIMPIQCNQWSWLILTTDLPIFDKPKEARNLHLFNLDDGLNAGVLHRVDESLEQAHCRRIACCSKTNRSSVCESVHRRRGDRRRGPCGERAECAWCTRDA